MIKIINESDNLSDFRGNSREGNPTRVRIKATGKTGWVDSIVNNKNSKGIRVIYDNRPGMYPDFFTVDEVEILKEDKEISNRDIEDIVINAMKHGSLNFNADLYTAEELAKITLEMHQSYQNLKNAVSQVNSTLRHKDPKLAHSIYNKIKRG